MRQLIQNTAVPYSQPCNKASVAAAVTAKVNASRSPGDSGAHIKVGTPIRVTSKSRMRTATNRPGIR